MTSPPIPEVSMADYCTVAEIKADIPDSPLSSTDVTYDAVIGAMITAASRLIDREVGRWPGYFYPSSDDETRYYDGRGGIEQWIDECISLSGVAVAEAGGTTSTDYTTWTLNSDYLPWPYNYTALGQPILRLDINRDGDKAAWPRYRKAVRVSGVFGYCLTPPAEIKLACKIQAMRWFMRAKQGWQDAGINPALGQMIYLQQLDPDVREILQHYRLGNMV